MKPSNVAIHPMAARARLQQAALDVANADTAVAISHKRHARATRAHQDAWAPYPRPFFSWADTWPFWLMVGFATVGILWARAQGWL